MKVPKSFNDSYYDLIHTWYTPSMLLTVISPGGVCQRHCNIYRSHTTATRKGVLHTIFLDLQKAYDPLELDHCLDILSE